MAPAIRALGVCEHIWPFCLRDIWATLLSPKWAEILSPKWLVTKRPCPIPATLSSISLPFLGSLENSANFSSDQLTGRPTVLDLEDPR